MPDQDQKGDSIRIVGFAAENSDSAIVRRGLNPDPVAGVGALQARDVPIDKLKANFDSTMTQLRVLFADALSSSLGTLSLETIELTLEVSAEGKVGLLGIGAVTSGTAGLKLTFSRAK